jgi:hypothetical protein
MMCFSFVMLQCVGLLFHVLEVLSSNLVPCTSVILPEIFCDPESERYIYGQYLELDLDHFVSHPSQFIIH